MILTDGMAHPGKLIEQAIVALLVTASTAAGDRVHRDRVDPFKKGKIPAIAIYMPEEEVDIDTSARTAPRELTREADVEMQLFVGGVDAEDVSDAMWDFQEQVENAMGADPYLGGAAGDSMLKGSRREIVETNGQSDPLVGVVTMVYGVTFRTAPVVSDELDDFLSVKADHRIVGAVEENQASDEFVVQELEET